LRFRQAHRSIAFVDDTILEAPETPAPVFAVRAFKQALFGTPQPAPITEKRRQLGSQSQKQPGSLTIRNTEKKSKADTSLSSSPTKPQGILLTPGTATLRRKQVTFGEVVDNEGKKPIGHSGIPNDCPGKFPSPWTPKTVDHKGQDFDAEEEKGLDTSKLTEEDNISKSSKDVGSISNNSKNKTARAAKTSKPRAKDDVDLITTVVDPKSPSGKYWKEQYLSYSANSEGEVKKLIAKVKIAKDYAKKKDEEAIHLRQQLETERRKSQSRERDLEKQLQELQQRLQAVMEKNAKTVEELASLRRQVEKQGLEINHQPLNRPQEPQDPIFEPDSLWSEAAASDVDASYLPKSAKSKSVGLKSSRTSTERREKPTEQLGAVRKQEDSITVRKREQTTTPSLDFFKTALSPITGSPSSPLLSRSPNIMDPKPRLQEKISTKEKAENRKSGESDSLNFASAVDHSAPKEALTLRPNQIIPPGSAQREGRQSRVTSKSPGIPFDRAAAAKERLAARRKMKEGHRDRRMKMNTVI